MKEQEGTNYSQLVERLKSVDKIVQRTQEQTEGKLVVFINFEIF